MHNRLMERTTRRRIAAVGAALVAGGYLDFTCLTVAAAESLRMDRTVQKLPLVPLHGESREDAIVAASWSGTTTAFCCPIMGWCRPSGHTVGR